MGTTSGVTSQTYYSPTSSTSSSSSSSSGSAYNVSDILQVVSGSSSSGIDVNAAVASGLYADRAPERTWQAEQVTFSNQTSALTSIQSAAETLQNDLFTLETLTGPLAARTVSSSNSNYVTATAATGTATGVHNVVVNTLAAKAVWYSDLAPSATATLNSSSFTITTKSGATATFNTGSGQTGDNLNDLAKAINANSGLGLTASVVTDGSGSRLAISSNSAGAANDFSVTSPNYTGTSFTSSEMASGQTLGANTITVTSSAGTATIKTTAGETYAQLASAINNAVVDGTNTPLGLTANSVTNSDGSTSLTVTGSSSFTISEPQFGFSQAAAATDATGTVDGVPFDSTSDTLTGAIPGVTISLQGATQGISISLTVAPDVSQISQTINQFVTDYNSTVNLVNTQFKLTISTDSNGNSTQSQGPLAQDPTLRNLQATLETALGFQYTPSSGTTTVSTLADMGITMNNDGTLSVNSTTLNNAITSHADDVISFFQGTALNGFANNYYKTLNTYTSAANGAFKVDLNSIKAQYDDLTQQIDNFESGYIASQKVILTKEYTQADEAMQKMNQTQQQLNALLGFNSKN